MKKILAAILPVCAFSHAQSQVTKSDSTIIGKTPAKSGLSYDALTQFFQTNISSGTAGGYDFRFTLFAAESFFSKDSLNASGRYLALGPERNLEFGLGLHKAKDGNYSLLLGSFKYAFVNNRDKSIYNFSKYDAELENGLKLLGEAEYSARAAYQKTIAGDAGKMSELAAADKKFNESGDFKEYPKPMQVYTKYLSDKGVTDADGYPKSLQDLYDKVSKQIDKKGLFTGSFNPGYDWNNSRFDTTSLTFQYLKGWGNYKKPWNINAKISGTLGHDSTASKADVSRKLAVGTLGLNKVLVCDSKLNPLVEFEVDFEYTHVYDGRYGKEMSDQYKAVTTLRVHITKEISVPITIKYDLKKPNIFGIFRLQWDLEGGKKS